jgi:hypothetical protein
LYQNDNVEVPEVVNVWEIVESPLVGPWFPSIAAWLPERAPELTMVSAGPDTVQPLKVPVSKPPLTMPPVAAGFTVQLNEVLPEAVPDDAVTVTDEVPLAVALADVRAKCAPPPALGHRVVIDRIGGWSFGLPAGSR